MPIPRWKWEEKAGASKPEPTTTTKPKIISTKPKVSLKKFSHKSPPDKVPIFITESQDDGVYFGGMPKHEIRPPPKKTSILSGPSITSGQQLRVQAVKELSGSVEQYKEIDPSQTYVYESGEQISGRALKQQMGRDIKRYLLDTTKIKPGKYIEKEGQYYRTSDELVYLLYHAEPTEQYALIESMGKTGREGLPSDFVGPIKPPFISASEKAYESLVPVEKEEYGYRFQPFKEEPVETWKHYPGGKKYIESLSSKQQEQLLTDYMGSESWTRYIGSTKGAKERQAVAMSIQELQVTEPATLIPGWLNPFGGDVKQPQWMADLNVSTLSVYDYPAAEKAIARKHVISDGDVFSILGSRTRKGYSFAELAFSAPLWPVALVQTGEKLVTGKTFLPDVGKIFAEGKITPTKGVLSGGIETIITGGKSDYLSTVMKYPWESGAASMGEFMGLFLGGKALHVGKVGAIRGLGYARSGIQKTTGIALPGYTKIMYYTPGRIFRRAWVTLGKKDIEKTMGIPYHSPETLTPGGLSFAKGSTPAERITWTLKQTDLSKQLKYSGDDFLLGSASGGRIGRRFIIKSKVIHELPTLSGAPYGFTPTRFYRFGASNLSYSSGTSFLPKMHLPSGFAIRLKNIYKAPGQTYDDIAKWAAQQQKGSWGVIAPKMYLRGPEAELNIFGKTVLKRFLPTGTKRLLPRLKGYEFYAKVPLEGGLKEVVPIVFTTPIHKGFPTGAKQLLNTGISEFKNLFGSSYKAIPTTPVLSPGYLLSLALSYSPSIPSPTVKSVSMSLDKSYPAIISSYVKSASEFYSKLSSGSHSSKPSVPSYPSIPSLPSIPSYPSSPSYPSGSSIPSIPSSPSSSSVTSSPSIPSSPSLPSYPSYPSKPSKPSSPSIPSYPAMISSMLSYLPFSITSGSAGHSGQAYSVFVKDRYIIKGKKAKPERFIKMSKHPLSRNDAFALGGTLVDSSAAASFKVKPTSGKPKPLKVNVRTWDNLRSKFYPKGDTFIEKNTYRIDTPGELKGITAKGVLANMERASLAPIKKIAKQHPISRPRRGKEIDIDFDRGNIDIDPSRAMTKEINKVMKHFSKVAF